MFGHVTEFPAECARRLLEIYRNGTLRENWAEAFQCLLLVGAWAVGKIGGVDNPDDAVIIGDEVVGDNDLLLLEDLCDCLEKECDFAMPPASAESIGVRGVIANRLLMLVISHLIKLAKDSDLGEQLIDWLLSQFKDA